MSFPLAVVLEDACGCGGSREMANRGTCQANLRGIVQSMAVYASTNGEVFPVAPFAPFGPPNGGGSMAMGGADESAALAAVRAPVSPVAGSPLAGPWMMVLSDYVSPKQFICKSDPAAPMPASRTDTTGNFYLQFQKDEQFSYSFAYPYTPEGKVGDWWKESEDPTFPITSDMAPVPGTGKPKRDLAVAGKRNSANHDGEGQNVAFGDNHVEFKRDPAVGQRGDNIFTLSGNLAGGSATGVAPTLAPIYVGGTPGNYDTVMVPERDLDTGKLW